ncbi:MBL fold metallo-hydrolase [Bradyrhizobium canariense]|uniref:MBL fold metallo-hydrolase n=1 Tax=Bradyrhizobium canariense TaxID=255045 RepID=A0A1X3GSU6_9BRAD|nr:MBL fold metallo-hydrolase [Bradyrhizobium canariense]OSI71559.1 MBL fold metallo-hydrolase [Bradyrhizobium canariense]OSI80522.1 MBL fold metallo-hydrolase [Bradyrhizobium canariense]OSI91124.1 MBL fold metallo-hydrolase [Bradyrhizobium canariense]OSI96735.1 MBL fold metallo-hydrolase [Bradyrhizobium canariense]OSJ12970.1 MBL fold metallo-hydrolase [Bradyrhizobium canariense]
MNGLRVLLAAMVFALVAAPAKAGGSPSIGWADEQAPGFYRLRLGDFKITVLSDGTASRDLSQIMSKPTVVQDAFRTSHENLPTDISINCFLVDTGATKILIDTGAGALFGASSGHLISNMRASGYAPEDINAVLLTHIHGDHSGGLTVAGRRVFPNALVYVDRRDVAYWLNGAEKANAAPNRRQTFEQSHQTVDPYVQAGKLRPFDGATELFPGIQSVSQYGHTPGHSAYMLNSDGNRLLLWGDIVHASEVQFSDPSIAIEYDVDAREAISSRHRALAAAAETGYLVGGAHVSFPGLGHVRLEQGTYTWVPAPYRSSP